MRGYDRTEMYYHEDLDEYEDDGEEQDQEVEEEYEEEQEDPKPTKEELEYLEMRQRLKEAARRKMKKENGVSFSSSQEKKKKLPYDNFGSFFGPSQPVIAQRVIQESKSLLENQHLAAKISNSSTGSKKIPSSTNSEKRPGVSIPPPRVNYETQAKLKAQKLKDNRDYSFLLSEDSELPAPKKDLSARNVSIAKFDARSAQLQPKSRQSMSGHSRVFSNGHEERKPAPTSRQILSKTAHHQVASGSRQPNLTSAGSGKQIGSKITGTGPGRPTAPKGLPSKMTAATKAPMSSKVPSLTADRKPYSVATKKPVAGVQKTPLSRLPSSVQHQHPEQRREVRRDVREPERAKIKSKMPAASSKPQNNLPRKTVSCPPTQVDRPKKRPSGPFDDDEEEDPSALIRKMFGLTSNSHQFFQEQLQSSLWFPRQSKHNSMKSTENKGFLEGKYAKKKEERGQAQGSSEKDNTLNLASTPSTPTSYYHKEETYEDNDKVNASSSPLLPKTSNPSSSSTPKTTTPPSLPPNTTPSPILSPSNNQLFILPLIHNTHTPPSPFQHGQRTLTLAHTHLGLLSLSS